MKIALLFSHTKWMFHNYWNGKFTTDENQHTHLHTHTRTHIHTRAFFERPLQNPDLGCIGASKTTEEVSTLIWSWIDMDRYGDMLSVVLKFVSVSFGLFCLNPCITEVVLPIYVQLDHLIGYPLL